MTFQVDLSIAARRDYLRLAKSLAKLNPAAARSARDLIAVALQSLTDYPERGFPGPKPGLRQLVVPFGASGYVIQYRVKGQTVVVVHIFHGRERR